VSCFGKAQVASGHPLTSEAAIRIMAEGGNAFDAVVAAGFTAAISEQALTSLGGGGFMLARTSEGQEILFDFFTDTPGRGLPESNLEPHFFPVTISFSGSNQDFNIGHGSVAVPGNLLGFLHVHERLGRLPLAKVLEPAIKAAREGVALNHRQAHFMDLLRPIMTLSEEGRRLYAPQGSYVTEGSVSKNPELSLFLEELPGDRGKSFYRGRLAERIADDMEKGNGLLTTTDLAAYKVIERQPFEINYRGHRLLTNPPPSFGGTLIGATLRLLETLPLVDMTWGSPDHLTAIAAVLEKIDHYRDQIAADPGHHTYPWLGTATGQVRKMFSRGTTHVSISDGLGNHASMTTSNGEGSGYIVPGTGIMLNNMMGEDDLHPEGFHAAPPGQRVASMMSPSLLVGKNGVEMVIGSGGSKRIRTAIPQVISNVIDFRIQVAEAVRMPRIHWDGAVLQVEPGFEEKSVDLLKDNWPVNIWNELNLYFGGVHTIFMGKPAGDPRRGGDARTGHQG